MNSYKSYASDVRNLFYDYGYTRLDSALCALMPDQCKLLRLTVVRILFDSFIGCANTPMLYVNVMGAEKVRKMFHRAYTLIAIDSNRYHAEATVKVHTG